MTRLMKIAKPIVIAGAILLGVGAVLKAMQFVYSGPLANESALAYNNTYTLNTANRGIDYLSTQIVYSSASPAAVSFTDGVQATGTITVTSLTNLAGKQGTNSITVSTTGALSGATIVIGGVTLTEGIQWYTQTSTNAVATSIKNAINAYATQFTASTATQANKVSITCGSSGTWCNTQGLAVSVSSLTIGAALFSGGVDNAIVSINNVTLIQGRDWTAQATSTGTARAISNAIAANTSLNTIITSTWTPLVVGVSTLGVVSATATAVGTAGNYALFSSTQASLTLSGSVTTDSVGRGVSAMTGGAASAVTLNSPIISVANGFTPLVQNQAGMLGLPVLYTATTALSPLLTGTTYFVIPVSRTQFELSDTSTGAIAGVYLTITSSSSQTTTHTRTLTPLAIAGTATFAWQGSNDGTNWYSVGSSSSVPANGYTVGGQSIAVDWGAYNYSYLKLVVTAPTAGGIQFTATANGRNTNR